jgi:hypothetical protein
VLVSLVVAVAALLLSLPYGALVLGALGRLAGGGRPEPEEAREDPPPLYVLAFVGLAALAAFAALWSLAGGLGAAAPAVALAGGVALALARPAPLAAALRRQARALAAAGWIGLLALAAGALLALGRAASPVENYDTGAYHAQAIRWLEEYGVVPGLANLHVRLALSLGWFGLSALFGLPFLGGRSLHALNLALYLLLLLAAAHGFAAWRGRVPGARPRLAPLLLMAYPAAGIFLFGNWLSSPSPDVAAAFLVWIAGALFLDGLERGGFAGPPGWRETAIAVLAGFAHGVKLSALPAALLPLYLAARQLAAGRRRAALALLLATAAAALPFAVQTAVASGYLLFPATGLDLLPFDWKLPPAQARHTLDWVRAWARVPHRPGAEVLAMRPGEWLPLWWEHQPWPAQGAIAFVLVAGAAALAWTAARLLRRRVRPPAEIVDRTALALAVAAGLALWFLGAPDPRFGWGFLLLAALLLALPPLAPLLAGRGPARLAAALLVFFLWHAWEVHGWEPGAFARAARQAVVPADYPVPATRRVALANFAALAPVSRDLCWYRPFPCTPFPDPAIELRGAGLAQGFRTRPIAAGSRASGAGPRAMPAAAGPQVRTAPASGLAPQEQAR